MSNTSAIILFIMLGIIFWSGIRKFFHRQKLHKISASRPKLNRFDFIKKMELRGFEYDKIAATYDEISSRIQLDDFSIYPEDDLLKLYKIDDFYIDEMIELLCEKFELNFPSNEEYNQIFFDNDENFDSVFILKLLHLQ